ncbi:baseplate J/gp47 family protein [Ralstonia nicotianae]|uniref:baseplate J/gp47 family protein n=1 Tax=Ralstonia syzygii TaxID=28097 RepID=UPI00387E1EE7
MTITSVAPVISEAGISAPSFSDVLDHMIAKYQGIYGSDVYLGNDSQDYQFLAAGIATPINDLNAAIIATYNGFSPATAQGANLSSVVKINGLKRNTPSNSTVDQIIVGVAGTIITNGVTEDGNGNKWNLPATVTIPPSGTITVTATCQTAGAVQASIGAVDQIATPTRGWQSVTNASAAVPGEPVETDSQMRTRQATSTALPSRTVLEGTVGAVWAISGVTRVTPYENDTSEVDANGVPGNKIYPVVEGGDATAIAQAIAAKKTPGTGTYGTTTVTVTDAYGIAHPINFYRPTYDAITCAISLKALAGYTSAIGAAIQAAVAAYINSVAIGGAPSGYVEWDSALTAAKSVTGANTFRITSLVLSGPGGAGAPDVPLAFNHAGTATAASVTLTVS